MAELTDALETRYGYKITAYSCECPEHPHEHPAWRDGRWVLLFIGMAQRYCPEQTVAELREKHINLKPMIPPVIQGLIDQIEASELRALRAEDALRKENT